MLQAQQDIQTIFDNAQHAFNRAEPTDVMRGLGQIVGPSLFFKAVGELGPVASKLLNRAKGEEGSFLRGTNQRGQVTSRGSWRKATLQDGWDSAAPGPTGGRLCPDCGIEVNVPPNTGTPRDWHLDHIKAWTKRTFPLNVTRTQVLDDYQKGTRLLCPMCNIVKSNR